MFKCPHAFCIHHQNVCDGINHCPNSEDEHNCDYTPHRQCPGLFKCKISNICVHPSQLCDNQIDCPLQDDEQLCDVRPCPDGCICHGRAYDCSQSNQYALPNTRADIKVLLLANNKLTGFVAKKYIHLTKLDISSNSIRALSQNAFQACDNIMSLNMSFNMVTIINAMVFNGLSGLYTLDLIGNPLRSIESGGFYGLASLPSLRIANVSLISDCALAELKSLEFLYNEQTYIHNI
jgi:hypothetical protein